MNIIELEKKHPDYDGFAFCIRALTTNKLDRQPHKNQLKIEGGEVYALDGSRLHVFRPNIEYQEGLYRVFKEHNRPGELILFSDGEVPPYPPTSEVIPERRALANASLSFVESYLSESICAVAKIVEEGAVNVDFLKDLKDHFDFFYYPETGQLLFENSQKTAVIMKLQKGGEE